MILLSSAFGIFWITCRQLKPPDQSLPPLLHTVNRRLRKHELQFKSIRKPTCDWLDSFRALKTFVSRIKIVCSALQIRSALGYTPFAKQMPSFAKHSPCFAHPCVSTANQFLSRSKNMVSRIKIVCCALRIRSALEYISTARETSSFTKQKNSSAKHSPSFAPQYFLSRNN